MDNVLVKCIQCGKQFDKYSSEFFVLKLKSGKHLSFCHTICLIQNNRAAKCKDYKRICDLVREQYA